MLRLLQFLIFGHFHKWKTLEKRDLAQKNGAGRTEAKGVRFIQECEHCGKVIRRDLI